jgi:uncharacterized repeat protein (TIGR01451 family)
MSMQQTQVCWRNKLIGLFALWAAGLAWLWLAPAQAAPFYQVPSNDNFAGATVIASLPYNTTQSTTAATSQAQDPAFPCIANNATTNNRRGWHSVWYVYTSTVAGMLHVDTIGSNYDTVLGVWTGTFGSLTNVACDDDSGGNYNSTLNTSVVAGTAYYIEVAGYYSYSSGNLVLNVDSAGGTVPNDEIDNAFVVSSDPYTYTQSTLNATTAGDDPIIACGGQRHSHSVWYSFTAPSDGSLHVDTSGSNFDTVLAVWTGTRGALTAVACHDDVNWPSDPTSAIDTAVTGGVTYYIEVVAYGSGAGGNLVFHASHGVRKPLYLHGLASPVTIIAGTTTTQIMNRDMTWGGDSTVSFRNTATYFYLYPGLAGSVPLNSTIAGTLFLAGSNNNTSVTVSLVDLAPDGSTVTIGSTTLTVGTALAAYTFSIASGNHQLLPGHFMRLSLATSASNRTATLYFDSAAHNSRVEVISTNFINVEWARTYDSAYPGGVARSSFVVGAPVYIRARASDPFGSYDVTTATLNISGIDYSMSSVYDSGADYRVFESVYTPTLGGVYPYTVTVNEGSEGTVRDTESGQFYASAYGVALYPDATLYTVPNTSVNYGLTLRNTGSVTDTFDFVLNASSESWATELYLGAVLMAADSNGDGVWEYLDPAYDSNGNGAPDLELPAGGTQAIILRKIVPPAVGEVVDTTILMATSWGDPRSSDAVILTTSTATGVQRKQLHLLGSGFVYTMSTRPGSTNATVTLGQGASQAWAQSPAFASAFDLRQGALSIYFYAVVPGSSPTARVTVYSGATALGSVTQTIASTGWQTFTIANPDVIIPAGGSLTVGISNTTTTSRSFTVQYNGTGNYDAYLDMPTKTYVNVDQIQTRSVCAPGGGLTFDQGQTMTITARVSDPFGGYDVAGANVRATDPGGVPVVPGLSMSPVLTATGAITFERSYAIPLTATLGNYNVVVTGTESNGVTATNTALFSVQRPATLTAQLSAAPASVSIGDLITVTMLVTNSGQASALNVIPSTLATSGTGSVTLASGPSPASVLTLTTGSATRFTWVYNATGAGAVTFSGSASGRDANSCAVVASPAVASNTVQIAPRVQFSSASYSVGENAGTAIITVTLSSSSGTTVTVNYATSDGTALAGSDYTAASGTLTFSPGVASRTFAVTLIDDMIYEGNETVWLTLSNPVNATLAGTNPATLTIVDDDPLPTVQFSSSMYSVGEGDGAATINVVLSAASSLTVTVNYATSDGTAVAGSDYAAASGMLTFAPGQVNQSFGVSIIDDSANEPNETVQLTLSAPTNATLSGANPAWLTIEDNDTSPGQVTITKTVSSRDLVGAGQPVTYTITILNAGPSTAHVQQITDTLPAGFTYVTTTATSGMRLPDATSAAGQAITWSYGPPYPTIAGGSSASLTFVAASSGGGGCNSAGATISGSIGVVAQSDMACVGWPEYWITAQAGSQTLWVHVRMVNGEPIILSWEFR